MISQFFIYNVLNIYISIGLIFCHYDNYVRNDIETCELSSTNLLVGSIC